MLTYYLTASFLQKLSLKSAFVFALLCSFGTLHAQIVDARVDDWKLEQLLWVHSQSQKDSTQRNVERIWASSTPTHLIFRFDLFESTAKDKRIIKELRLRFRSSDKITTVNTLALPVLGRLPEQAYSNGEIGSYADLTADGQTLEWAITRKGDWSHVALYCDSLFVHQWALPEPTKPQKQTVGHALATHISYRKLDQPLLQENEAQMDALQSLIHPQPNSIQLFLSEHEWPLAQNELPSAAFTKVQKKGTLVLATQGWSTQYIRELLPDLLYALLLENQQKQSILLFVADLAPKNDKITQEKIQNTALAHLKGLRSGEISGRWLPRSVPVLFIGSLSNAGHSNALRTFEAGVMLESDQQMQIYPDAFGEGFKAAPLSADDFPAAITKYPKLQTSSPNADAVFYTPSTIKLLESYALRSDDLLSTHQRIQLMLSIQHLDWDKENPQYALQEKDPFGVPVYLGETIAMDGIVQNNAVFGSSGPIFLKVGMSSVALYGEGLEELQEGDSLRLQAPLSFSVGQLEAFIDPQQAKLELLAKERNVVPIRIDFGQLLALDNPQAWLEKHEGLLIELENVQLEDPNIEVFTSGLSYSLKDMGDLLRIQIDKNAPVESIPLDFAEGFKVRGILTQFDLKAPFNEGYQLLPRGVEDVQTMPKEAKELKLSIQEEEEGFFKPGQRIPIEWEAMGIEEITLEYRFIKEEEWERIDQGVNAMNGRYDFFAAPSAVNDSIYVRIMDVTGEVVQSSAPIWIYDKEQALRNGEQPVTFALLQNYPNPFNPITSIGYTLPEDAFVRIEVFNSIGQQVDVLVNTTQSAGYHEVMWSGNNQTTGIYIYKMTANSANSSFIQMKKMTLVK